MIFLCDYSVQMIDNVLNSNHLKYICKTTISIVIFLHLPLINVCRASSSLNNKLNFAPSYNSLKRVERLVFKTMSWFPELIKNNYLYRLVKRQSMTHSSIAVIQNAWRHVQIFVPVSFALSNPQEIFVGPCNYRLFT